MKKKLNYLFVGGLSGNVQYVKGRTISQKWIKTATQK